MSAHPEILAVGKEVSNERFCKKSGGQGTPELVAHFRGAGNGPGIEGTTAAWGSDFKTKET